MSTRFRFNKELNYKLAALEVFLPNQNAFAFVASLKIYCTSRGVISFGGGGGGVGGTFHCIFVYLYLLNTKGQLFSPNDYKIAL